MDITKAQKLVTNTLDDVEPNGAGLIATFRSSVNRTAVAIYVDPDNTFHVGSSTTADDNNFLEVADAYQRAATFIRHSGLTAR